MPPNHRASASQPSTRNWCRRVRSRGRLAARRMSTTLRAPKPALICARHTRGIWHRHLTTHRMTRSSPKRRYRMMYATAIIALCSTGISSTECSPRAIRRLRPDISRATCRSCRIRMCAKLPHTKFSRGANSHTESRPRCKPSTYRSTPKSEAHTTSMPTALIPKASCCSPKSVGVASCARWIIPTSSSLISNTWNFG